MLLAPLFIWTKDMAFKVTIIHILSLVLLLLTEFAVLGAAQSSSGGGRCIEIERQALLEFKAGLKDPAGQLSSWAGQDCCSWFGVSCSNQTSNVVKLDLQGPGSYVARSCLGGTLNPSLLVLKYLNYLDLSRNCFQETSIPEFISSFQNLTYLDLSRAYFSGMIPPQLGNLSNLVFLDLTDYSFNNSSWVSDLNWLSGLHSLQYLALGGVNLSSGSANWLPGVNMLPSLLELHLSGTILHDLPQSLPFLNLTSLSILDLSSNDFYSSIPQWIFNITTLQSIKISFSYLTGSIPELSSTSLCKLQMLDLSLNDLDGDITQFVDALSSCTNNTLETLNLRSNNLNGHLPDSIGLLSSLQSLQLARNKFSGPIPTSVWNMSRLNTLDLSFNMINGTIPENIGKLTLLSTLGLYGNSLNGIVTQSFLNHTFFTSLSFSSTDRSLVFDLPIDWIPPFSLFSITITGCKLGFGFPAWLKTQSFISDITLSDCLISDIIPHWIWSLLPGLSLLDLSQNQLRGALPNSIHDRISSVDLSFNQLEGSLPIWPNLTELSLKSNRFSCMIPSKFGEEMSELSKLDISQNDINGTIPPSMSNLTSLSYLDLSSNNISGQLPRNWQGMRSLMVLDLSSNNLSGGIPSSLCSLYYLFWLKLNNNNLYGELSSTLLNCSRLYAIDIGTNNFFGTIPDLLSHRDSLSYLGLRANLLTGSIPDSLCYLSELHILDLAHNNFSGSIPNCLGNLTALKTSAFYIPVLQSASPITYLQHTELVMKGRKMEYTNTIDLVKLIDLSDNTLSGEIPEEITSLLKLGTLNLSMNMFSGKIPDNIRNLQELESLDLSLNQLSGPIPASMSSMTSLSHLNLSFNNLSGLIPSTNQFLTFNDPSIFEGNPNLCGSPLPNACGSSSRNKTHEDTYENEYETLGFFVSIAAGYIVGFWGVCGSLVLKRSWRYAFFRFVGDTKEWIFVLVTLCIPRKRQK